MKKMHHYKPEKCIDCACCDADKMKCFPDDKDCMPEYDLDEQDLITPTHCDFFRPKE